MSLKIVSTQAETNAYGTVITDPDDKNFDPEAYLTKVSAES